jgi:hypothetical protein
MKKQLFLSKIASLILILSAIQACSGFRSGGKETQLKVLQLNLWFGTRIVPEGLTGLIDIIRKTDPDVAFLCEIANDPEDPFIPNLIALLEKEGLHYTGERLDLSMGILSKYPLQDPVSVFTLDNDSRPMIKASIEVGEQTVTLYSAHLDYRHFGPYLPRGYSSATWKKIEAPVTDAKAVLEANRIAFREEAIRAFVEDAAKEIEKGRLVIMGGDLNEPSHLDWRENTKDLWDRNGAVIDWDCSVILTQAGYVDTYRAIYPDPVHYPGFTYPSENRDVEISKLAWAPDVDERDRIDFIYYFPAEGIQLKDAITVGPSGSVYYGKFGPNDSKDKFIEPDGVWPTDHKGTMATFTLRNKRKK